MILGGQEGKTAMKSFFARVGIIIPFLVGATGLLAAEKQQDKPPVTDLPAMENGWLVTVKGNFVASPTFPGAESYSFIAYPSLAVRRANDPSRFGAPDDGVSIGMFGSEPDVTVGVVGRYQRGRYSGDSRKLSGLSDARWALEPGVFAEYWPDPGKIRLRAEARFGLNGYNGPVGSLGADYVQRLSDRIVLSGGPRVAIAGEDYMQTYYGVTATEAQRSHTIAAYKASAGVRSVGATAALAYGWTNNISTTVYANYDRLVGSAAESSVTKTVGSPNQFTFGAQINYTFPVGTR
jgi:outer membrane protein